MELKLGKVEQDTTLLILLIVPYGIETESIRASVAGDTLLIVPYGIET